MRNIRKLVDEDHVDVVVGPNITPAALAALDAVAAGQTPMITLVGSGAIVEPQEGARDGRSRWRRATARWPT